RAVLRLPHRGLAPDVLGDVSPLLDVARLSQAQEDLDQTPAPDDVIAFIVGVIRRTRTASGVVLGASPRAAVHLRAAAKAHARLASHPMVTRQDVIEMAPFVLPHRLIVSGVDAQTVVADALNSASELKPSE